MEYLARRVDIPTAARLRTVSKEWKDCIDRERVREEFQSHARKNMIVVVTQTGKHNIPFEDVTNATGEDVLRRLREKGVYVGETYRMSWVLPIPRNTGRDIDPSKKLLRRGFVTLTFD